MTRTWSRSCRPPSLNTTLGQTFVTRKEELVDGRLEPVGDASGLDVSDKDPLAAATSCWTETDHAEAQTAREGPGKPNQLCMTTLFSHTHTHTRLQHLWVLQAHLCL